MNNLQRYNYGNYQVEFNLKNDEVFVNATEMAKVFNKQVNDFLRGTNTKEFIKVLELKTGIPVFKTLKGRHNSGSWMHRQLALKFAAWLSPDFEVWVYDVVDRLLFGNFKELQRSIKDSAKRKLRIEELKVMLSGNENFKELERLQLEERQAAYKRTTEIKSQMEIFN